MTEQTVKANEHSLITHTLFCQVLASASGKKDGDSHCQICIWSTQDGACTAELFHHQTQVQAMAFSWDDKFLVTIGEHCCNSSCGCRAVPQSRQLMAGGCCEHQRPARCAAGSWGGSCSLGQQGMQQLQLSSPDSPQLLNPPVNGFWLLFIVCRGKSLLLDLLLLPRWTWTEVARLPTVSLLPGSHASTGWMLKLSVLFRQGTFKGQHAIRKLLFSMRGDLWSRQ